MIDVLYGWRNKTYEGHMQDVNRRGAPLSRVIPYDEASHGYRPAINQLVCFSGEKMHDSPVLLRAYAHHRACLNIAPARIAICPK
jgi:hypothetical protein